MAIILVPVEERGRAMGRTEPVASNDPHKDQRRRAARLPCVLGLFFYVFFPVCFEMNRKGWRKEAEGIFLTPY